MKITGYRSYVQRVSDRPRVLLRLDTDEGISGWGEAFNHGPDRALPAVFDYLFDQIKGIDPRRIEFIMQKLLLTARFPPGAIGLAAQSAIDHALWDISAKAVGLPVYMMIGGNARDRVPVYAGVSHGPQHGGAARDRMQALNERYGFTAFKLHPVGSSFHQGRWGEVCDTYASFAQSLREGSPSHWEFGFDFKGAPGELNRAVSLGKALAPYDPMFYEEPLPPYHEPEWARLRAALDVPLATGERLYNRHEFLALMAVGGVDIIQPDICVVGGLLEMRKIAAIAEAHLVTVSPHNPMGPIATAASLHFCAAQTNVRILEYNVYDNVPWIQDPYVPKDGFLELRPDRPGWGVELDEAWLEKGDDYVHWQRPLATRADGSIGII